MLDNNEKYLKLVTSEYYNKPLFMQYVETFLNFCSPAVDCLNKFNELFNLDNAVGEQLDFIGTLVNIHRSLPINVQDIPNKLGDESYRLVIKAKIMKDHWDGTREGMESIMLNLFPEIPFDVVDNQDMSISITIVDPNITDETIALIENGYIIPKPAGVGMSYTISRSPIFSWDKDTSSLSGWDIGIWSNT